MSSEEEEGEAKFDSHGDWRKEKHAAWPFCDFRAFCVK